MAKYNSPGAYGRSRLDGDAREFYQRFRNLGGLLWLAEALRVNDDVLEGAIADVIAAGANPSSQCGAFRRRVPWTLIEPLAAAKLEALPKRGRIASAVRKLFG